MSLYCLSFGFRQPYQVLIDAEMCKSAIAHKLELFKQIASVLQGDVKPMITQCCIHELYLQGKEQQPAVDLAKSCERRMCNHREPIPGDECLLSVIGETNKHRYVIATQSHTLRVMLRSIPAAPLVHINRSVMVLEPPSDSTLRTKALAEEQALHATAPEIALVGTSPSEQLVHKKRKGPKGPNPLSVKKKTSTNAPNTKGKNKPASSVDNARAGVKRQRAESDEIEQTGEVGEGLEQVNGTSQAAKRRKRRRKHKSAAEPLSSEQ